MITLVHDCDRRRFAENPDWQHVEFSDSELRQEYPSTNYGGWGTFTIGRQVSGKGTWEFRAIIRFDLRRFIPASATIISADWWVKTNSVAGGPNPHIYRAHQILDSGDRFDWVEGEVTWFIWKAGSSWTTPGGDVNFPEGVTLGNMEAVGWNSYDITDLATDAWANHNGILTYIVRRTDFHTGEQGYVTLAAIGASTAHHLRITYTLAGRTFQVVLR